VPAWECELHEVGFDWLTATARHGFASRALGAVGFGWIDERKREGYQSSPWAWNGYKGETTDGITFAEREDGAIIRLSSDMCRRHVLAAIGLATNISRVDLQVTCFDPVPKRDHAIRANYLVEQAEMVKRGQVHTKLETHRPRASTFYIGSRVSSRFFRLYDKHAESGGEYAPGTWRYEVEYKGDRAFRLARRLAREANPARDILGTVTDAFATYLVPVPVLSVPIGWREKTCAHTTDDQRRLEWLRRCIRPTVLKLSEAYSVETLAGALGMHALMDETTLELDHWSEADLPEVVD